LTTILVVGATGMTGQPLVQQLLDRNHNVRVVVRSPHKLSANVLENPNITVKEATVLNLTDEEMVEQVKDCDAVVSCLGHTLDFKGMFGDPKKLCTDTTQRLCSAIEKNTPSKPTKFILMNTVGVKNPDREEKRAWFERALLFTLGHIVPPHQDNETAVEHLYQNVSENNKYIEWCSVRPDSLINAQVSPYEIKASPTTDIFTGRPTTLSNVAYFMTDLIEKS
jgi:nucleoside-diphosphate-sugar epimerase